MGPSGLGQLGAYSGADIAQCGQAAEPGFREGYTHNGYFTSLKAIVHFYNTRDLLPRCQPHDAGEGTTCWPARESTDNMNKNHVGNLGLSEAEEDAIVSFMQTLTDGFMPVD
jgi:cytochrome c peroxidase